MHTFAGARRRCLCMHTLVRLLMHAYVRAVVYACIRSCVCLCRHSVRAFVYAYIRSYVWARPAGPSRLAILARLVGQGLFGQASQASMPAARPGWPAQPDPPSQLRTAWPSLARPGRQAQPDLAYPFRPVWTRPSTPNSPGQLLSFFL